MAALKTLWGVLALLFHVIITTLIAVLGAITLIGRGHLNLPGLPWSGGALGWIFFAGGLFGLVSLILAAAGRHRYLFLLWSLALAVALTKVLLFSAYTFPPGGWRPAVWLLGGSWFSVVGAVFITRSSPAPGPRKYRVK